MRPQTQNIHQDAIMEIFNQFKLQDGRLDRREFLSILNQSGVQENCSILIKKLENTKKDRLSFQEFKMFFNLDLTVSTTDLVC